MIIKRLFLKNIRSYESEEIYFANGSILLSGDIGVGKTTILLAIEYALFGLQPGQKGSSLLRNNCSEGEVSLEFEIGELNIIIERRLKRSSKSVTNEYSAITLNGQKSEYSTTELKTKILEILGYPSEFLKKNNLLYRYTVYTPQEHMKQIILEDSETRLNILRHIFGVDKYKRIRENLLIVLSNLKEESKFLLGETSSLDSERNSLSSLKSFIMSMNQKIILKEEELNFAIKKRKLVELEACELELKIKEKEKFEKEVEKTVVLLSSKKEMALSLEKELVEISKNISEFARTFSEFEFADVINKIASAQKKFDEFNHEYTSLNSKSYSIDSSISSLSVEKQRIFNLSSCPTCLQNVPDSHKYNILNAIEEKIAELKKEAELLSQKKSEIHLLISREKDEIKSLEESKASLEILKSRISLIERSKARMSEIQKSRDAIERDISILAGHIDALKSEILHSSKYLNLHKLKQDELKESFKTEKNCEISLAELKKEVELTNKEIQSLEEKIAQKELLKNKLSSIQELSDWLSNYFLNLVDFIERNVMIKLRVEFSKLFSKWFNMLAGESFEVHLDESFTPLMLQRGVEMDYSFLSGGERTSIALAYRLALNQTVNMVMGLIKTGDLIVLDEPTDGFSDAQLDRMRLIFDELNFNQLIIVSHEQKMESFVENVIRLRKENDISYLEKQEIKAQKLTSK